MKDSFFVSFSYKMPSSKPSLSERTFSNFFSVFVFICRVFPRPLFSTNMKIGQQAISQLEVLFDKFKLRFETADFSKIGKSLQAKRAHSEGEVVTSIAEGFCFCSRLESGSGTIFADSAQT